MPRIAPELATQSVAVVLTATIFWILYRHDENTVRFAPEPSAVQLSLEPAPPAPEPPKAEPVRPQAHPSKVQKSVAAPAVRLPPAPIPAPAPAPGLSAAADGIDAPGAAAPVDMAAAAPARPPSTVSHASIESAYAAALRQNVDERTTAPNTAEYRLLKPSGAAQVRFVLDRAGEPRGVSIARTSGSRILDHQALDIVASGRYPPFPETAFPGETQHAFIVTIERALYFAYLSLRSARVGSIIDRDAAASARSLAALRAGDPISVAVMSYATLQTQNGVSRNHLEDRSSALFIEVDRKISARLWVLDTIITAAPLLGLLGTILGIMETFGALAKGGISDPAEVSRGIGMALMATAIGIATALLGLLGHNILDRRAHLLTENFKSFVLRVTPEAAT